MLLLAAGLGVLVADRGKVEEPLALRTVSRAGGRTPAYEVALSPGELQRLWGRLVQPPDMPEVDFGREWVLAALMGEKPTGGYRISIDGVRSRGRTIRVAVSEEAPGPEDFVAMVFTYPGHWVAVERPRAPGSYEVVFENGAGVELARREVAF